MKPILSKRAEIDEAIKELAFALHHELDVNEIVDNAKEKVNAAHERVNIARDVIRQLKTY
jgi:ABC-type Fe3+-hydroxamate transport system substrate-binding protein